MTLGCCELYKFMLEVINASCPGSWTTDESLSGLQALVMQSVNDKHNWMNRAHILAQDTCP